jgi:hypothetical protein
MLRFSALHCIRMDVFYADIVCKKVRKYVRCDTAVGMMYISIDIATFSVLRLPFISPVSSRVAKMRVEL